MSQLHRSRSACEAAPVLSLYAHLSRNQHAQQNAKYALLADSIALCLPQAALQQTPSTPPFSMPWKPSRGMLLWQALRLSWKEQQRFS